jgi:hypothetical protein
MKYVILVRATHFSLKTYYFWPFDMRFWSFKVLRDSKDNLAGNWQDL